MQSIVIAVFQFSTTGEVFPMRLSGKDDNKKDISDLDSSNN